MRIGVSSKGLLDLQDELRLLLCGTSVRKLPPFGFGVDLVVGWGHKKTAENARHWAKKRNVPYIAVEDGFLRSVHPGNSEKPLSLVLDRTGIYYDARQPSDFEAIVKSRIDCGLDNEAVQGAMKLLKDSQLSKYNNSKIYDINTLQMQRPSSSKRVLVIDQTKGDASIEGAMATETTFAIMLETAIAENPGSEIWVRVHPEVMQGKKAGHFTINTLKDLAESNSGVELATRTGLLKLVSDPINPWVLLDECDKVYCVSSQLGFEGLIAGCEVHTFGMPFYGGWGLTLDRLVEPPTRRQITTLETLFAAAYFDYCCYIDHGNGKLIDFNDAIRRLVAKRAAFRRD